MLGVPLILQYEYSESPLYQNPTGYKKGFLATRAVKRHFSRNIMISRFGYLHPKNIFSFGRMHYDTHEVHVFQCFESKALHAIPA